MTKFVIFPNRRNNLFHLMHATVYGENCRRLDSRYATSLEQPRKAVADWQTEFNVAARGLSPLVGRFQRLANSPRGRRSRSCACFVGNLTFHARPTKARERMNQ